MERVLLEYEKLSIHFDLWPTFRIQCNKLYAWNSSLCMSIHMYCVRRNENPRNSIVDHVHRSNSNKHNKICKLNDT